MITQDADISTPLDMPAADLYQGPAFGLQVRLWRLLSTIVTSMYRMCRTLTQY